MKRLAPQWIVDNIKDTITFYEEKLGFSVDWIGETPLFAIVSRDQVTIMFRQLQKENLKRPNRIPFTHSGWHSKAEEAWDAYIWVDNVDELFKSIKEKNITIIKNIQDSEYGNRDFEIEDNNGYILCFGQVL